MAVGGKKPKPTQLRLIQGNPGGRPINVDEPVVPPELPEPPEALTAAERVVWYAIGVRLKDAGLIANLDEMAFALLCQTQVRYDEATALLKKHGSLVKSPNGWPMQSPYLPMVNQHLKQLMGLLTEFGMTPSSRSRIHVDSQKPQDEFEDYLSRGPGHKTPR